MKQFKTLTLAVALLAVPALASASTILQFTESGGFNTPFTITGNGATATISGNKTVSVTIDPAFCAVAGCGGIPTTDTYVLNLVANSIGTAQVVGTSFSEAFSGTFSFTGTGAHAGLNLLTVNFTDLLQGSIGGTNPTLQSSQPPDSFSGTSAIFGTLNPPRGFSFGFSNLNPALGVNGTAVRSGVGDLAGTINATASTVPEPTSMVLLGSGLALFARKLKARKQ
jgi:hypothetical protein